MFNNGVALAQVSSLDGKKALEFLIVCAKHERNRDRVGQPLSHKQGVWNGVPLVYNMEREKLKIKIGQRY